MPFALFTLLSHVLSLRPRWLGQLAVSFPHISLPSFPPGCRWSILQRFICILRAFVFFSCIGKLRFSTWRLSHAFFCGKLFFWQRNSWLLWGSYRSCVLAGRPLCVGAPLSGGLAFCLRCSAIQNHIPTRPPTPWWTLEFNHNTSLHTCASKDDAVVFNGTFFIWFPYDTITLMRANSQNN